MSEGIEHKYITLLNTKEVIIYEQSGSAVVVVVLTLSDIERVNARLAIHVAAI